MSLILIDGVERLKMASFAKRHGDVFDRTQIGPILIRVPGLEKRLARYPQFDDLHF